MPDDPDEPFNASRAEVFDALGHPTRIKILQVLSEKPLGFSELKRAAGIESNGLLSFHLGKLTGLVKIDAEGSYALTEEGREALRMVEASRKQTQEAPAQHPSVRLPHLKTILAGLVVVLIILAAASAIEYNQIQTLDSRTQPAPQTVTETATVTSAITTISTTTATTTVTSTLTGSTDGPPVYKADQVIPVEVNNSQPPSIGAMFTPDSIRLVVGINNSVSFVNDGVGFVGVQSLEWPVNATGFESGILGHNESWSTTLTVPGVYIVNNYLRPVLGNLSILVVDVANVSASTSSGNTISISGLSICASGCTSGQTFSASIVVAGDSPLSEVVLYLNATSEGLTVVSDNTTNYTYQYSANFADSYPPIVNGDTYFVELVAVFANGQLALATASVVGT